MKIIAERNGQLREFDQKTWKVMPPHKYGWKYTTKQIDVQETKQVDLERSIEEVKTDEEIESVEVKHVEIDTTKSELKKSSDFSTKPADRKELEDYLEGKTPEQIEVIFEGEERATILKLK